MSTEKYILKNRKPSSLYENSKSYESLGIEHSYSQYNRLKISPYNEQRWEVPFEFGQKSASDGIEISRVDLESGSVAFKVTDKKNGATIFNTQVGPIIFEEMFMQVRFCTVKI